MFLFLCFFIGLIDAATMPFSLPDTTHPEPVTVAIGHSHCDEVVPTAALQEDGKSTSLLGGAHFCCSALACSTCSVDFISQHQSDSYLSSEIVKPLSTISESIFRPPRTEL